MSTTSILCSIIIMLLKVGILLEWIRIFVPLGIRSPFWWTCHITIVINVIFYVFCIFFEIFHCKPRQKSWEITLPGKCIDTTKALIAASTVNFASDLVILLLPQKVIWGLRLSRSRKAGIATLFSIGVL